MSEMAPVITSVTTHSPTWRPTPLCGADTPALMTQIRKITWIARKTHRKTRCPFLGGCTCGGGCVSLLVLISLAPLGNLVRPGKSGGRCVLVEQLPVKLHE